MVSSAGGDIAQSYALVSPWLAVTANRGGESQTRSFGRDCGRQGGLEQLDDLEVDAVPERLADEALALLDAPDCPSGVLDLVLLPSQMVLQIHESIGHPLELDRILGDERNYAGTSFVTPEMFGSYRYGSELLNVANDPQREGEFASFAFDDEGTPAPRHELIRAGVLLRGLGGAMSQLRSGLPGSSSTRACSWNRPPIDRMANLNLSAGDSSLEQLVAGVERGILMDTNRSWSIDDSRNKFQFGCEYARLIEDGRLTGVVKNANYRGISASFWRSLTGVGAEVQVAGTPNCGKGEPNQVIHVGHASPACRFAGVDVFGGG
jgi:predicted Zn-dependent protease